MDMATLAVEAKPLGIDETAKKLEVLSGAAGQAEVATKKLTTATGGATGAALAAAKAYAQEGFSAAASAKTLQMHAMAANANEKSTRNLVQQQRNLQFQLIDTATSLASGMPLYMVAMQQGGQIAQIWGAGEGGVGRAFKETGLMIGGMLTRFPLLTAAVAGVGLALGGMTIEMNRGKGAAVGFGEVAVASLQVLRGYLWDTLKPAVDAISPWFWAAWDGVTAGVKFAGNLIINSFRAAFEDIKFVWAQLPNAIGAMVVGAANTATIEIGKMIQSAADKIDSFARKANEWLPEGYQLGTIGDLGFTGKGMPNTYRDALEKAAKERNETIKRVMGEDPLGEFYGDVASRVRKNAAEEAAAKAKAEKVGKVSGPTDAEKYDEIVEAANRRIAGLRVEEQALSLTSEAASRLRSEQELINEAQEKGLVLSPAQRQQLTGLAATMAAVEERTRMFRETLDFARNTSRDVFDNLLSGLREGKSLWKAFGDAATSALETITPDVFTIDFGEGVAA